MSSLCILKLHQSPHHHHHHHHHPPVSNILRFHLGVYLQVLALINLMLYRSTCTRKWSARPVGVGAIEQLYKDRDGCVISTWLPPERKSLNNVRERGLVFGLCWGCFIYMCKRRHLENCKPPTPHQAAPGWAPESQQSGPGQSRSVREGATWFVNKKEAEVKVLQRFFLHQGLKPSIWGGLFSVRTEQEQDHRSQRRDEIRD